MLTQEQKQAISATRQCHHRADQFMEQFPAMAKAEGRTITCGHGCYYCCDELLIVELEEALIMASIAASSGRLDEITERLRKWKTDFMAAGMHEMQQADEEDGFTSDQAFGYREKKLTCPFMKGGLCMVYKHRPTNCRTYVAVSDVKYCRDVVTESRTKREIPKFHPSIMGGIMQPRWDFMIQSGTIMQFDHLGCFLSEILLKEPMKSAAFREMRPSGIYDRDGKPISIVEDVKG